MEKAGRSFHSSVAPGRHPMDTLHPDTGAGGTDGVAPVSPAKEVLFAMCNLQQVTLDRLFTSCPCKGQVRL